MLHEWQFGILDTSSVCGRMREMCVPDRMCAHGTTVHRLVFTFRNDLIVFIVNIALRLYILILRTNGYRSFIRCRIEFTQHDQHEVVEASQERYFVLPLSFVCVSLLSLLVNFHQNKVQGISSITNARKLTLFKESKKWFFAVSCSNLALRILKLRRKDFKQIGSSTFNIGLELSSPQSLVSAEGGFRACVQRRFSAVSCSSVALRILKLRSEDFKQTGSSTFRLVEN